MGDDFGASLLTRAFNAIPVISASNGRGADAVAPDPLQRNLAPRPESAVTLQRTPIEISSWSVPLNRVPFLLRDGKVNRQRITEAESVNHWPA